jgi:hypothetical protein
MTDPQGLQAGADRHHGRRGLRLDIVVELLRGPAHRPHVEVARPAVPGGADVIERHAAIGGADLALNAPILDLERDAAGMREVLWMEPEDGYTALVQLDDDGISVLVVVVGDNEDCVRHVHTSGGI